MKAGKSMQELSECDELKTFFDRRLIKALGHPVREHILAVLNERIASASEIGEELGADVSSFYHHIEELEKLECIERVETRRRRGANEHFFRARRTVFFDDESWQRLPASLRADLITTFVQAMFNDAAAALAAGTLDGRGDEHVSWTPVRLDAQGWEEATDLMDQTLSRVTAILDASSIRLAATGEDGLSATVGILAFETPMRGDGEASGPAFGRARAPRPASAR
jgi:DNA-binding transcriptional ArsR family regulator